MQKIADSGIPSAAEKKLPMQKAKAKDKRVRQVEAHELRNEFNGFLAKLSAKETKSVALNELKRVVENSVDPAALRVFLSSLSNSDQTLNSTAKEGQLEILTFIIEKFKDELLDPLDNPPTLIKTVQRICAVVCKNLNDSSTQVHVACANALLAIHRTCLSNKPKEQVKSVLYTPLEEIVLSSANKHSQAGAAKCIHRLALEFYEQKKLMLLLCPSFVNLFVVSDLVMGRSRVLKPWTLWQLLTASLRA